MSAAQSEQDELLKIVSDRYYILASSSYADDQTRELNYGDTFAIFDRWGDVKQFGKGAQGLYYSGTRYIDDLEFRINDQRPILLSSNVKSENDRFSIELSNPRYKTDNGHVVDKGSIHISRKKFLTGFECFERIELQNFAITPVTCVCTLKFAGDFKDIFEVRGMDRTERGTIDSPRVDDDEVMTFRYTGVDRIVRIARIKFHQTVTWHSGETAHIPMRLAPGEVKSIDYSIICEVGEESRTVFEDFQHAWESVSTERETKRRIIPLIESSSDQFNHWIRRSTNDLLALLSLTEYGYYPYAGVPWYNTPFGRDGIITALQTLWMAPEIARGALMYLAATQADRHDDFSDAEPGKILHEARGGEMVETGEVPFKRYYGTIDATPLFVVLAGQYLRRTADVATIETLWENILMAIEWIEKYGDADKDGFVEYKQKLNSGLINQGWKDSHDSISHEDGSLAKPSIALCEVQGYVYDAYMQAIYMANALNKEGSSLWKLKARELKRRFNEAFWDTDLNAYVLALDGDKKPCRVKTSNAGHCLYSGIVDTGKAARLVKTMMQPDLFCGWGMRTLSSDAARYNPMSYHNGSVWPHDTSLVASGLARYGFIEEAMLLTEGLFRASLQMESGSLPELFCGFSSETAETPTSYPVACAPQAWAVASIYLLIQSCLQITIDAHRKKVNFKRPQLPRFIEKLMIRNLKVPGGSFDFDFHRYKIDLGINIISKPKGWDVIIHR